MLRGLFRRRQGSGDPGRAGALRVKALAANMLLMPTGTEITANEIVCLDPSCPGTETVILVMTPGQRSRAAKVAKAASEVTEQELRTALVEAGFEVTG